MAIPTLNSAGAGASDTGANTVPLPASYAEDDFLLLAIETNGSGAEADPDNPLAPQTLDSSGWTLYGSTVSQSVGFGDQTRLTVYYKRAAASETTPTVSAAGAANHWIAFISAFSNVDWVNGPINVHAWGNTSTNDTTVNQIQPVTTTLADCLVVSLSSAGGDTTFSSVVNASLANPAATLGKQYGSETGTDGSILMTYGGLAVAGASGSTVATSSLSEEEANLTVALPGLLSSYTFAPDTFNWPLNDEKVNHSLRYSLWRHYSGVIPTPYVAIITGGVANTAPGVVSPSTFDIKGNAEVPNAEYSQVGADDSDGGEDGRAVFYGGKSYTITAAEREILNTAGYGANIT